MLRHCIHEYWTLSKSMYKTIQMEKELTCSLALNGGSIGFCNRKSTKGRKEKTPLHCSDWIACFAKYNS